MTDWEIQMHNALRELSGPVPSTKGLPPKDRAERLHDEVGRRRRVARDAMGPPEGHSTERITRAITALDTAPDVDPAKATRAEVSAMRAANLLAWTILTEGRDPPSRRGATPETPPCAINSAGVSDA